VHVLVFYPLFMRGFYAT